MKQHVCKCGRTYTDGRRKQCDACWEARSQQRQAEWEEKRAKWPIRSCYNCGAQFRSWKVKVTCEECRRAAYHEWRAEKREQDRKRQGLKPAQDSLEQRYAELAKWFARQPEATQMRALEIMFSVIAKWIAKGETVTVEANPEQLDHPEQDAIDAVAAALLADIDI